MILTGTLQKIKDKGTNDPLYGRLFFGVLKFRDFVFRNEEDRLKFDYLYTAVFENLEEAMEAMNQCIALIEKHKKRVKSKKIISFQGEIVEVSESVDSQINKNFKDFFIKGDIAIKSLSPLAKMFGFDVAFLLKDEKEFEREAERFLKMNTGDKFQNFVEMLKNDRKSWYMYFNLARGKVVHKGATLPRAKYVKTGKDTVEVLFPTVDGESIPEFLTKFWTNLFEFIEDFMMLLFSFKLEPPIIIVQIPEDQRDKSLPLKYDLSLEGMNVENSQQGD